ncbi:MAG: Crp/Fnr family transcriptional regulator [Acidobacteria bacterium]|nr:Crp/Fnr family transcriptional regulator [Acidobacteriota bacterium]
MPNTVARLNPPTQPAFDVHAFLESGGVSRKVVQRKSGQVIYSQGDPCDSVFYIQDGGAKLRVLSHAGKEAIVAMLDTGDFFGEGALAGQPLRMTTAIAVGATSLLVIEKAQMTRLLHEQHALSDRFLAYVLARNIRVEADLVDHLFNSSEKRLARALLLLARFGKPEAPHRVLPRISQETLAEMVGTTRSRVNYFMNKFKKLGFIEYNGDLKINDSLLTVVLHD